MDSPKSDIGGAGNGDALTPGDLVRRYGSAVLALCLARARSVHDAEDIMQEVFLRTISRLHTLRDPGRARQWLFQIARRACIDHYRRSPRTLPIPDGLPQPTPRTDPRVEHLREAVSKLPEKYREAILLYYLDGRSCPNVAACLGISAAAARQRLARGRLMLHDLLTEQQR